MLFVDVILPLSIPAALTYGVPEKLKEKVLERARVEVEFGRNKVYSGIISRIHQQKPDGYNVKPIKQVLDTQPIISALQLHFWNWIASYYCCTLGEVMQAALPAHLKLMNEYILAWSDSVIEIPTDLSDEGFILAEALQIKKKLSIQEIKLLVEDKNHSKAITEVLDWGIAYIEDELKEKYREKKEEYITLNSPYSQDIDLLEPVFDNLKGAPKQLELLTVYFQMQQGGKDVLSAELLKKAKATRGSLNGLIAKGIFEKYTKEVSRLNLGQNNQKEEASFELSEEQQTAFLEIKKQWENNAVVLLHGVTGSGKTMIYIRLIEEQIKKGKQVLFLLPEIALTTQILQRLYAYFGDKLGVYHSRFSNNERVEIWKKISDGTFQVVIGARSALWLPFQDLGLIIVDEEHETSYKQYEPAPRFQARDSAVYLANLHECKTLLGSATPSLESIYNVQTKKYGYVPLLKRYQEWPMPEVEIVAAGNIQPSLSTILSLPLLNAIQETLSNGRQVLLFQNKRGYAPFLICALCGHIPHCPDCDVSLTYHKYTDKLHCHYCARTFLPIKNCPKCGSNRIISKSFGTEKIEEELLRIFPKRKVGRMDTDSVRGKNRLAQIIRDFERGSIDILVGTQMIVKGLDFGNVGLAGILSADSLLSFPEFRVNERAFQLMVQLSGRVGRMLDNKGKVIIQSYNQKHPVLNWVKENAYASFYREELALRKQFAYPPYTKLIKLVIRHQKQEKAATAAGMIAANLLKSNEGMIVQGPTPGIIPRIRNNYIFEIHLKLRRDKYIEARKQQILQAIQEVKAKRGYSVVYIYIDVDPG